MRLQPKLMSFDVFGTLISVRDSSYGAFERILADARAHHVDVKAFWEHWEHRNIAHYWEPYRSYRDICELSLSETFAHFGLTGSGRLIERYFDAFPHFFLYDDVARTLDRLSRRYRLRRRLQYRRRSPRRDAAATRVRPRVHGTARAGIQA
jgi:2-haloacid dehalogenase